MSMYGDCLQKSNLATGEASASAASTSGEQKRKVALITGITGQDGAYLAELLLGKGYATGCKLIELIYSGTSEINESDPAFWKVETVWSSNRF